MVVLAGIGHAWKRGRRGELRNEVIHPFHTALPAGQIDQKSVTTQDADYVLLQ
jgi:hypothetical protein